MISRSKGDHVAESLSSLSSDTIDETNESRDESASIFYDDDHYPPTVDKSKKWRYRIGINLFNRLVFSIIKQSVENLLTDSRDYKGGHCMPSYSPDAVTMLLKLERDCVY